MPRYLAIAFSLPILMACVPALQADPVLTPEQVTLVQQTCDTVMGLKEGGEYRALCQDSLSHSLARKIEAEQMAQGYDACRAQGVQEEALATCMLDHPRGSPVVSKSSALSVAYDRGLPRNATSYFGLTPSEAWHQEQYACAQLGLIPGTNMFQQCAVGLEGALFPDPN